MSEPEFSSADACQGAGAALRQARERAGLHAAALAATLKVPLRQIEALEAGRLYELPDATFARALAASVCRALKLDPAPVLAQLPAVAPLHLGPSSAALDQTLPSARLPATQPQLAPASSGLGAAAGLALLLLLAAAMLWLALPHLAPQTQLQQAAPVLDAQTPALPEPPAAAAPLYAPAGSAPVEPPASAAPAAAQAPGAAPPLAFVPALPAHTGPVAPPASAPTLQLSAQQTAWVQVTGASGRVWLQRSLQPGESVAFDADWPLQLVVGRVDAVQATLQGQALDLTAHSRNNVARLQVRPSP